LWIAPVLAATTTHQWSSHAAKSVYQFIVCVQIDDALALCCFLTARKTPLSGHHQRPQCSPPITPEHYKKTFFVPLFCHSFVSHHHWQPKAASFFFPGSFFTPQLFDLL
jgi:hypothetical protein